MDLKLATAPLLVGKKWIVRNDPIGNVINPATGLSIGGFTMATSDDIEAAISAASAAFALWRKTPANERSKILIKAAGLLVERCQSIGRILSQEQGKPLAEAIAEVQRTAEIIEWYGQEARRIYGRTLPTANETIVMAIRKQPIGPVAAFTPWNFPLSQAARKLGAALAAGCTIIMKGSEDTPFCTVELVRAFIDAGLPNAVLQLLYGDPAMISSQMIADPAIRKVSFTGSVPVGRLLAEQAGKHLKYATMELGGHAPTLVFDDVDPAEVIKTLAPSKYRNAGQVCVSPTRMVVHRSIFDVFVEEFGKAVGKMKVGNGLEDEVDMGPVIHARHLATMEALVDDAVANGAGILCGGKRIDRPGFFFEPTVLTNVPLSARIMNEEPFGPIAIVNGFDAEEEAVAEANRLPLGLAAYLYTASNARIRRLADAIEAGMISVNGIPVASPDAPFGGVKDSGFGREGGIEGIEEYLVTKFIAEKAW